MILIQRIIIKQFRSIRSLSVNNCGNFNIITGINNSGKSNVLRALSLFFNDEIEPGIILELRRDFGGRGKEKKEITIAVEFNLPYYFAKNNKFINLINKTGDQFTIVRKWNYDDLDGTPIAKNDSFDSETANKIIKLIKFRFIPAHRDPANLIRREEEGIRKEIVRRIKSSQKFRLGTHDAVYNLLYEFERVAGNYISPVSKSLSSQIDGIQSVKATTPRELSEIKAVYGYSFEYRDKTTFSDRLQGSGVQSTLLYQVLQLADTSYSRYFGNKQAVIWAVEEPECFLHTNLECDVAAHFKLATGEEKYRFQVFASTHSDIFMQYADKGYIIERGEPETKAIEATDYELVEKSAQVGISRLDHLLLWKRKNPLVIVEGRYDRKYLCHVANLLNKTLTYDIFDLETISKANIGGIDTLKSFFKKFNHLLRSRPRFAPIIICLDWEVRDENIAALQNLIEVHPTSKCIKQNVLYANPQLHSDFKGIERFLSTRIIEKAAEQGIFQLAEVRVTKLIKPENIKKYKEEKGKLNKLFIDEATEEDTKYLRLILEQIEEGIIGI